MRKCRPSTKTKLIFGLRWPLIRRGHMAGRTAPGIAPRPPPSSTQRRSNWAVWADQSREEGAGGGGHTCKNQLPTPLTRDEPYAAAIPPDCVLHRALHIRDRNRHLPLVHHTKDTRPNPLRHGGMLLRPGRMNRIRPLPCTLSGVGGPGAHVHPRHRCQSHSDPALGALPAEDCISPDNGVLRDILVFIARVRSHSQAPSRFPNSAGKQQKIRS